MNLKNKNLQYGCKLLFCELSVFNQQSQLFPTTALSVSGSTGLISGFCFGYTKTVTTPERYVILRVTEN